MYVIVNSPEASLDSVSINRGEDNEEMHIPKWEHCFLRLWTLFPLVNYPKIYHGHKFIIWSWTQSREDHSQSILTMFSFVSLITNCNLANFSFYVWLNWPCMILIQLGHSTPFWHKWLLTCYGLNKPQRLWGTKLLADRKLSHFRFAVISTQC